MTPESAPRSSGDHHCPTSALANRVKNDLDVVYRRVQSGTNPDPDPCARPYRIRADLHITLGDHEGITVDNALVDEQEILAHALDNYTSTSSDNGATVHMIRTFDNQSRIVCTEADMEPCTLQRPDAEICPSCAHGFATRMFLTGKVR